MKNLSADEVKAIFPFPRLDPIVGEPTYLTLRRLETQVIRNAAAIDSGLPHPHNDLSGIAEQDPIYVLRVGAPFPRPPNPGPNPVFPAGANAAQRAQLTVNHQQSTILFQNANKTEAVLKTLIENAIEPAYLSGIHTETHGFGARTVLDIFQHLFQAYRTISPAQLR